jgi:hydroxyacylglutathione hydrolase
MKIVKYFMALIALVLIFASPAQAQMPVVGAEDVKSLIDGKKRVVLIDTRNRDEYVAGHIPGAINIPADRMKREKAKLPKDPSTPIIFYCRGVG